MINIYDFNYDFYKAGCKIEIDREKFTEEIANETLTFFSWDYNKSADPIDEVVKKYAMLVIEKATDGYSITELRNHQFEGFVNLDGSLGIMLLEVEAFEFVEEDLSITKIYLKEKTF